MANSAISSAPAMGARAAAASPVRAKCWVGVTLLEQSGFEQIAKHFVGP